MKTQQRNTYSTRTYAHGAPRRNFTIQEKFYSTKEMHEFIEREIEELRLTGEVGAKQTVFEKLILWPGWQKRLEALRKKHRAAGIPDHRFFDNATRKEMGLPPIPPGRKSMNGR